MNKKSERLFDFIAGLFGVFEVDWNEDFADDGYGDILGRKPIAEPIFVSDAVRDNRIRVVASERRYRA